MLVLLALLAFFAIALPDAMHGVAWPFMRISLGQPLSAMSLVLPFGVAATVLSASYWTVAAARIGLGRLLTVSVVASAAALLATALAPAFWVILACAVVFGLSAGAIDAALNAYAARHFGARRINQMHAAYGIGAATSPLIVTTVVGVGSSWRWAYAIVMVIQVVLAVCFALTARRWDGASGHTGASMTAPRPTDPSDPRRWWRQRPAMSGVVLVAVEAGLEAVIGLWTFVFLLEALLLPTSVAGAAVSGYWAALVVGRLLLGPVAERRGPWPVLAGSTALACVAAVLLSLGQPALAVAALVALGLALAPVYPLLVLTTAQRTTAASVDRLVGLQAAASTVGCVIFPGLVGLIMEASPRAFAVAVLVLALATSGGLWALRPGHRSTGRDARA